MFAFTVQRGTVGYQRPSWSKRTCRTIPVGVWKCMAIYHQTTQTEL